MRMFHFQNDKELRLEAHDVARLEDVLAYLGKNKVTPRSDA